MKSFFLHSTLLILAGLIAATAAIMPLPRAIAIECANITCNGAPVPDAFNPGSFTCHVCCQQCNNECIDRKKICILEPLPGGITSLDPSVKPLENFWQYINGGIWKLLFGIGVGSVVFNGVIAGLQIVFSNGDSGAIGTAKTKMIWSIIGLIILVMAGVIMAFINPVVFTNI